MKRGRKPKPTALKLLEGTRTDRLNPAEPPRVEGDPLPADHLDPIAQAEFRRLVELLRPTRLLSQADGAALSLYSQTFARWVDAEASVKLFGMLVQTDSGSVRVNPAVSVAQQSVKIMHRLLVEFGLTPSSRSTIAVAAQDRPQDALESFLQRKKARGS